MCSRLEYVSVPLAVPPDHNKRLHSLAGARGIELEQMLREWIADELTRWIPDEATSIRRSPGFREVRFGAGLRELYRIQNEYGPDLPRLRGCIRQLRNAISRAQSQEKLIVTQPTDEDEPC